MYSYNEAYEASLEYFNGNDLSAKVFVDKYSLRDNDDNLLESTPDDMHRRLAKEFSRIEAYREMKTEGYIGLTGEEIYNLFKNYSQIIPQGSPITAIGNPYQYISASNCFVVEPPCDSYSGILYSDEQLVNIAKRRGGTGIDLSKLRPAGTPTANSSRSSTGILSWMKRYSNSIREVGQGGRRGALMMTISVHHPQILDFIRAKDNETEVTGANVSVQYTDEFLKAVEDDTEYEQRWPVDDLNSPTISNMVRARDIWKETIHYAWKRAEPGVQFIDKVFEESIADCYWKYGFKTVTSNPCQPGWACLLTRNGIRQLQDVNIGDEIWSSEGWTKVINKWSTGIKEVYKYSTTFGVFYGTKNHKIVENGQKIEVQNAQEIDIIIGPVDYNITLIPEIIMDGIVLGDGSVHEKSNNLVHLYIGEDDQDYFDSEIKHLILKHRPGLKDTAYEISTLINHKELPYTYERRVPDRYVQANRNIVCSFLRGLYTANGSVCGNRITLKSASLGLIEDVQMMLSSIGIRSYYTTNKPSKVQFENGEYLCKQSYDLNISTDREKFVKLIGFIQKYKNDKIVIKDSNRVKTTYEIISSELISEEEVFDITVDNKSHTYWTQSCNVSNCSEIFLSILDSCRLLAINVFSCVVNAFTPEAYFDFNKFYELARKAQRLADVLVDLEKELIQRIIDKIDSDPESDYIKERELNLWKKVLEIGHNGRRTGTGITALGDAIAAINIPYGSDLSIQFTDRLYKTLKFGCFAESIDMAKVLGPFPVFDHELEKDNPFINRLKDEFVDLTIPNNDSDVCNAVKPVFGKDLWLQMSRYGRRNIALLTTAPTGSISTQAELLPGYFGSTGGIEPAYSEDYWRFKKGNPGDTNFKTDFIDKTGDHWMRFKVYHQGLELWRKINPDLPIEQNPYKECCAEDINWINRVKLQAAAQQHIDHSISSTVNLPSTATEEDVDKIFMEAWRSGCKGITVYRDGCRSGVLVKNDNKEKINSVKRPTELPCELHHLSVKGEKFWVAIGLSDGTPYEVFAGRGALDPELKFGKIVKTARPKGYKAVFDEFVISPLTIGCGENEQALLRMISTSLRHGVEVRFVVEQLEKSTGDMFSFARAVARSLKKYIEGEVKEKCPDCGGKLVMSESCAKCVNCSYSKCG